jgi:hypothetical protein
MVGIERCAHALSRRQVNDFSREPAASMNPRGNSHGLAWREAEAHGQTNDFDEIGAASDRESRQMPNGEAPSTFRVEQRVALFDDECASFFVIGAALRPDRK